MSISGPSHYYFRELCDELTESLTLAEDEPGLGYEDCVIHHTTLLNTKDVIHAKYRYTTKASDLLRSPFCINAVMYVATYHITLKMRIRKTVNLAPGLPRPFQRKALMKVTALSMTTMRQTLHFPPLPAPVS